MHFSNLNEWLAWQENLHPTEIELGLDRVSRVWKNLTPARIEAPVITVAGTNGKGSCVAILESIYQAAGYRTAVYSSPHLLRYNERIRINGKMVTDDQLCNAFQQVDQARGELSLTYFEFGTIAALYLFQIAPVDILILEVGLGGRLDAVNIIDPDVAIITSIGLDHQDWLGSDLESIGREKAGIFRRGIPVVCGEANPPQSLINEGRRLQVHWYQVDLDYHAQPEKERWSWRCKDKTIYDLPVPGLFGQVQLTNAATALMAINLVSKLPVSHEAVADGLESVTLAGRFQRLPGAECTIVDVAHNPDAAQVLAENLRQFQAQGRYLAVIGMFRDKDVEGTVNRLKEQVEAWYCAELSGDRGLSAEQISRRVSAICPHHPVYRCAGVKPAIHQARADAKAGDCVLVLGSFNTVAEALSE